MDPLTQVPSTSQFPCSKCQSTLTFIIGLKDIDPNTGEYMDYPAGIDSCDDKITGAFFRQVSSLEGLEDLFFLGM